MSPCRQEEWPDPAAFKNASQSRSDSGFSGSVPERRQALSERDPAAVDADQRDPMGFACFFNNSCAWRSMVRPVCAALSNCVFSRVGILLAQVPVGFPILGAASGTVDRGRRRFAGFVASDRLRPVEV